MANHKNTKIVTQINHYYKQWQTPTQIARILKLPDPEHKGRLRVIYYIKTNKLTRPALKKLQ